MDDRIPRLWQRGLDYFNQGNLDAAQTSFESILARDPDHGPARFRLSMVAMRRGNLARAIALAREVRQKAPDQLEVNTHLSRCLLQAGQTTEAKAIAMAIALKALHEGSATVLESLGTLFHLLGDSRRALPLLDKANERQPGQALLLCTRAQARKACGRLTDAETDLEACLAIEPGNAQAHWQLADLRHWDESDNHVERLQAALQLPASGNPDEDLLAYALFKELDDLDRRATAWPVLEQALAARRARQRFDPGKGRELFDLVRARFQADFLANPAAAIDGPSPIFLVGMPRSGIDLMEGILGRHSQIRSTGMQTHFLQIYAQMCGQRSSREFEQSLFDPDSNVDFGELGRRFLAAHAPHPDGKPMFVENQPMNFAFLACIRRALPNARIVHMQRDPSDSCFSLLCRPERESGPPVFDPLELAEGHLAYQRLLEHWCQLMPDNIFVVQYESLVVKPEMVLRVMFAFLGLRYEAGVLAGVTMHQERIGRWRRYAEPLAAMHERLQAAESSEGASW
jgi:tetratricopeptide (TPR) repeat protein